MNRSSVLAVPSLAANYKRRSCGPRLPERILCAIALTAVVSVLTAPPARGADFFWTGDRPSSNWDANILVLGIVFDTNWSPDLGPLLLIPGTGDDVLFLGTATSFNVNLNGNRTVNSAEFGGGSAYSLNNNTLTLESGDITATGTILGTTTHTINSNVALGAAGDWDISTNSEIVVSGVVSGGFQLTKIGTGSLALLGSNTYAGNTRIEAGTLLVGGGNAIPDTSSVRILTGAIFEVAGGTERIEGLQNSDGELLLTGGATLELQPGALRVFPGTITGAVDTTLAIVGGSIQRLNGANPSFLGITLITGGTMQINHVNALQNSTVTITVNGGLDINGLNATLGALAGTGNLNLGAQTLTAGGNGATTTYLGILSGNGGTLVKDGTDRLTLSGANTYSGGTTINGGTLLANNTSGSATGTGAVAVESGGTLGGTGSVAGAVTVNAGGTVAPGVSPGILTLDAVSFTAGSMLDVEIVSGGGVPGTDFDVLDVTTTANLDGALFADMGFTPAHQESFVVMTFASRSGVFSSVTDSGLPDMLVMAPFYTATDLTLSVELLGDANGNGEVEAADYTLWANGFGMAGPSYNNGDFNRNGQVDAGDYTLWANKFGSVVMGPQSGPAAVPEPSTLLLAMVGIIGLSAFRRRRRRKSS